MSIEAMPLYTNLDRIARGLAAVGIGPDDPIPPERLSALDQWHYHGTEAVRDAARRLGLGPGSRVLDIGAGVGGPARLLAHEFGCHVVAVELQPALDGIGRDLTRRCGLADRVTHVCGDALALDLPAGFDAAVSWLAILHMQDRVRLCTRVAAALRPGGQFLVEDLCARAPFAGTDLRALREIVFGITVTDPASYAADLRAGGFAVVEATDLTADWAPFAKQRLAAWRDGHAAYAAVHGGAAYTAQELFYATIDRLYDGGSLGGVRLVGRRAG